MSISNKETINFNGFLFKIGDKVKVLQKPKDFFAEKSLGIQIEIGDILEIIRFRDDDGCRGTRPSFSNFRGQGFPLEWVELVTENVTKDCTCEPLTLFRQGCICGFLTRINDV